MIVTEEEAKTKRCQEAFAAAPRRIVDDYEKKVFNHADFVSTANAPQFCIGSACMAWKWTGDQPFEHGGPLPLGTNPSDPEWEKDGQPYEQVNPDYSKVRVQRWKRKRPGRVGCCGKVH